MGKLNFKYLNRDFYSLKEDLKSYLKVYYPNEYNDFSESTIGMALIELNAYVGDILSYHVDHKFNELFLDSAQNRDSVIRLAKNLGYNPRGRSPSATILDVSITVPVSGDTYNEDYLITIQKGMRASSTNGTTYEITDEINFANHTSRSGIRNRTIVPNYNSQNEIINYTITKSMGAVAGITKSTYLEITESNAVPFLKWKLDTSDVSITEVLNLVSKYNRTPPENEVDWGEGGDNLVWHQVDSLPQDKVFIDTSISGTGSEGYWKTALNRFIGEYDENGVYYLTFGGGIQDYNIYNEFTANSLSNITAASLLNNDSLGYVPQIGTFLHCRYRTGGGANTNTPSGTITRVESRVVSYIPGGASLPINTLSQVLESVSVNNPIPAIGGRDFQTLEEIKQYSKSHFSSQDRCVTSEDYSSRISLMPFKYGSVFRSRAITGGENIPRINIYVLTRDENGKLKNTGNDQIKYNLAAYIEPYRMINDVVTINDGVIINLSIDFVIQIQNDYNKQEVIANCINVIKEFFDINNFDMNSTIYLSQIEEQIRKQPGVINIVEFRIYNMVGGNYASNILSEHQRLSYDDLQVLIKTGGRVELSPINNAIKAPRTGMFEIKYPEIDIRGAALT